MTSCFTVKIRENHFLVIDAKDFEECKSKLELNASLLNLDAASVQLAAKPYRRYFAFPGNNRENLSLDDMRYMIQPTSGSLYYNLSEILNEEDAADDSDPIRLQVTSVQDVEKIGGNSYEWMVFFCHEIKEFIYNCIEKSLPLNKLKIEAELFEFNPDKLDHIRVSHQLKDAFDNATTAADSNSSCFLYEVLVTNSIKVSAGVRFLPEGDISIGISVLVQPNHQQLVDEMDVENADEVIAHDLVEENNLLDIHLDQQILLEVIRKEVDGVETSAERTFPFPDSTQDLFDLFKENFPNLPLVFIMSLYRQVESSASSSLVKVLDIDSNDVDDNPVEVDLSSQIAVWKCQVVVAAPLMAKEQSISLSACPTLVQLSQQVVADRVFEKALQSLGCPDGTSLSKQFKKLEFLIMVPAYNTLRQQTMDRLREFEMLVGTTQPDTVIETSVMLYPVSRGGKDNKKLMEDKIKLILENEELLFILIVDECHYGPTMKGIPMLQHPQLQELNNFLAILVSATPYNVLSLNSRIKEDNRVVWGDALSSSEQVTTYVGFEYYARSIAFRCKAYDLNFVVGQANDNGRSLEGLTQSTVVSIRVDLRSREFANYSSLYNAVTDIINQYLSNLGWSIELNYVISKRSLEAKVEFVVKSPSSRRSNHKGFLLIDDANDNYLLLRDLGFRIKLPLSFDQIRTEIVGSNSDIHIDDDFPVSKQHFRSDITFKPKKTNLESLIDGLVNTRKSVVKYLPARYEGKVFENVPTLQYTTLMKVRNGFIIVLDYILSLTYFAVCGKKKVTEINQQTAGAYLAAIVKCCYFVDKPNAANKKRKAKAKKPLKRQSSTSASENTELCNLLPMADIIVSDMIKDHKLEMNLSASSNAAAATSSISTLEVIASMLREKRLDEAKMNETSENQTWFSESDRIIKLLLEQQPAPMVLLRVYDNDENLSIQRILRHALTVYYDLVVATQPYIPPFSVIGDISGTNLYDSLEDHFLDKPIDHDARYVKLEIRKAVTKFELI